MYHGVDRIICCNTRTIGGYKRMSWGASVDAVPGLGFEFEDEGRVGGGPARY